MANISDFLAFPRNADIALYENEGVEKLKAVDGESLTTSWRGYFCRRSKRPDNQKDVVKAFRAALTAKYAFNPSIAEKALKQFIPNESGHTIKGSHVYQVYEKAEKLRWKALRKRVAFKKSCSDPSTSINNHCSSTNKQFSVSQLLEQIKKIRFFDYKTIEPSETLEKITFQRPSIQQSLKSHAPLIKNAAPYPTNPHHIEHKPHATATQITGTVVHSTTERTKALARHAELRAFVEYFIDTEESLVVLGEEAYPSFSANRQPIRLHMVSFLNEIAALPFKEKSESKSYWEHNKRIVVRNEKAIIKLELVDNISNPSQYSSHTKLENRGTNQLLKLYVAYVYGTLVANELWRPHSELSVMLEHGDSLTQHKLRQILEQAEELQLHYEVAARASRWTSGTLPPLREMAWFENDAAKRNYDFFHKSQNNPIPLLDYVTRLVPLGVEASRLGKDGLKKAEPIENQFAVLALMDYLEYCHISPEICAYVWWKHLDKKFTDGRAINSHDVAAIHKEATALNEANIHPLKPENADEEFKKYVLSHRDKENLVPDGKAFQLISPYFKQASSSIKRWRAFVDRIFLGEQTDIPTTPKRAKKNRTFMLNLAKYIAFHYGEQIAEEYWNSHLKQPFVVGIRIGSNEIISILKQAQDKSQNRFTHAEACVKAFSSKYLRDSEANREELGLDSSLMKELKATFESKALIWVRSHPIQTDLEMEIILKDILHQHYAKICVRAMVSRGRLATSEQEGTTSKFYETLRDGGCLTYNSSKREWIPTDSQTEPNPGSTSRIIERLAQIAPIGDLSHSGFFDNVRSGLTLENFANTLHLFRNGGNLTKYSLGTHYLGVNDWTRLYQLTLSPEERKAYYTEHPHMVTSEPQIVGVGGSTLGVIVEFLSLVRTLRADKEKQHNIRMLTKRYRAAMYLCENLLSTYQDDGTSCLQSECKTPLPTKRELEILHEELKEELNTYREELDAAVATYQRNPMSEGSYLWRHPSNMLLNATAAGISGAFVSSVCPQQLGLWDRNAEVLMVSNFASDAFSIPVLPLIFINSYKEYNAYKTCRATKQRAKDALEELFQQPHFTDLYDVHQTYVQYKATNKWYVRPALAALAAWPEWQNWLKQKCIPNDSARRLISGDMRVDFTKAILRAQNDGTHLFNLGLNTTRGAASIFCILSSMMMIFGENGTFVGAGLGTAIFPGIGTVIGTVLGGIASASIGLTLGLTTLFGHKLYNYAAEKKRQRKIQELIDAYIHHEGPKWQSMLDAGLTTHQIEQLAFTKLIRRSAPLALAQMAIRIQKERNQNRTHLQSHQQAQASINSDESERPIINLLSKLVQPHKPEAAARNQALFMENNHSKARIDELSEMKNAKFLQTRLESILIPA